jgi:hypothetical protein
MAPLAELKPPPRKQVPGKRAGEEDISDGKSVVSVWSVVFFFNPRKSADFETLSLKRVNAGNKGAA